MHLTLDQHLPRGTLLLENTHDVTSRRDALLTASGIALQFPKWVDGRAYSQARLLRSRLAYAGPLLATGEVLVDMLPLLQRCGFSVAVLRADQDIVAAQRALGYFEGHHEHYQADLISKLPRFHRVAVA